MQKSVLIIIVIAVLIAVILAVFYLMMVLGNKNQGNTSSFEMQGMKVEVLRKGNQISAKPGDTVTVNYIGMLADGKKFESSYDRKSPFIFKLGENKVIKGWDLGVAGMKVGEKRRLTIPAQLAYGENGFPPVIPRNATLIYEIELLRVN